MLDLLERRGLNFDSLDSGQSLYLHSLIRPRAKPQSLCSAIIEARLWWLAWVVGREHCVRSWERYR